MSVRKDFADVGLNDLQQWASHRQLPLLFERSVKIQQGNFEDHRLLFSFPLTAIGPDAEHEVLQICQSMRTPEPFPAAIARFLPSAEFVHFGFERSGSTLIGKCYLELPSPVSSLETSASQLTFIGYKWSMKSDTVAVVSRYLSVPASDWSSLIQPLVEAIPKQTSLQQEFTKLCDCFQPGEAKKGAEQFRLLQVLEEGSDRRSWDLNVYASEQRIADIADGVFQIGNCLEVAPACRTWLNANAHRVIGHIAAGSNRNGVPFVTIYHSAALADL